MPDADGPKIVIAGTREDWPGGAQTLTPRDPTREPNGRILWFGAALDADGGRVVAFAGRARFDGVNSGVGERTGDDVRVEHPDTKGAGDCEAGTPPGRNSRAAPAGSALSCVANGRLRHMLIGYARVSKTDGSQSLDLQRDALQAAGVDAVKPKGSATTPVRRGVTPPAFRGRRPGCGGGLPECRLRAVRPA